MAREILYQVEAYRYSPAQVAEEFAARYWDKPRQVDSLWRDRLAGVNYFTVEEGQRTYQLVLVPATYGLPALWQVLVAPDWAQVEPRGEEHEAG